MSLFTPYTFTGQKATLRYDPNAAQLRYATPGMIFPDLGMTTSADDISDLYRGGGPANVYPIELTFNQPVTGSAMTTAYGSKWLNEGYRQSTVVTTTGALLARTIPDTRLNLGASDFTMEYWTYPTTTTARSFFNNYRSYQVATTQMGWFPAVNAVSIYAEIGASEYGIFVGRAMTVPTNQWSHIALTRTGSSWRLFLNGTQQGTTTTRAGTINGGTTWPTYIGNYNNANQSTQAFQDARIYIGVCKYTATFTPPPNMIIAP